MSGRKDIDQDIQLNFTASREFCLEKQSDLFSLHSPEEDAWLLPRLLSNCWLNFMLPSPGQQPTSWLDGTPFDYSNWRSGKPDSNKDKIYARIYAVVDDLEKYGTWENTYSDRYHYMPVCMVDAISGPVAPTPPDVTAPPHVDCDPGWHFRSNPDSCFLIDTQERAWTAAEENCIGLGGTLASINSPSRQVDIFGLAQLDPSSLGSNRLTLVYIHNCSKVTEKNEADGH